MRVASCELREEPREARTGFPRPLSQLATRNSHLAIPLLAILASFTSLTNTFAYDDVHIVQLNDRVHSLGAWWRLFGQSYWPPAYGATLYRPLTMLGFAGQWVAGGGSPAVFHVVSVLLYALVCLALLWLARALLAPAAAWWAAALFAVHPVHVEAVANVVGQAELWVALAVVIAAGVYARARVAGRLPDRRESAAILALYAAACLAKEHAVVLPALLAAAELTVARDARAWGARADALRPLYLWLALVGVGYLWAHDAFGGSVAYDDASIAFASQLGGSRHLTMLGVVPEWVRLLLWPAHLSATYAPQETRVLARVGPEVLAGLALLAAAAGAAVAARRRFPAITFGIAWTAIALLPVSNLIVPTGVLLAERTLFLPSAGAAMAGGGVMQAIARSAPGGVGPGLRAAAAGALALLLGAAAWRSASRQRVWRDTHTLVRQTLDDAPLSYVAHRDEATLAFLRGEPAVGEREMRIAMALMPYDSGLPAALADRYREAGLCAPAVPLYRRAISLSPLRTEARVGLAGCLLSVGDMQAARAEARSALAYGGGRRWRAQLERVRTAADSALRARVTPQ